MIVDERQLDSLPRPLAMVDGCFDPLHKGHVEYFRHAATLGASVLCNLAADEYILRMKKRAPLLPEEHRAAVIDAMRSIDFVFVTRHGTLWSLERLRPSHYVKGADWRGKLPGEQVEACRRLGIEIVYADCVLDSSTRLLESFLRATKDSQGR